MDEKTSEENNTCHPQTEARERQERIVQAVGDFLLDRKKTRPAREAHGQRDSLFAESRLEVRQ